MLFIVNFINQIEWHKRSAISCWTEKRSLLNLHLLI